MSNRLMFDGPMRLRTPALFRAPPVVSWAAIRKAWRRYRTRQHIAELDGHLLKDIGVSFADAENEANKPFWRG